MLPLEQGSEEEEEKSLAVDKHLSSPIASTPLANQSEHKGLININNSARTPLHCYEPDEGTHEDQLQVQR